MPTPFDNQALTGTGSCGCHQSVLSPYALPSGAEPFAVADFVNEAYLVDGDAVAVTDMFSENLDWGGFNPAHIVNGSGYASQDEGIDGAPAFAGDALSAALTEGTVLIEFELPEAGDNPANFSVHDHDFNVEYTLMSGVDYSITDNMGGVLVLDADGSLAAGVHRVVVNVRDGGFAGSLDGAAVGTRAAVAWDPAPTEFWLLVPYGGCILRKVAVYPQQDDADLPALSAP